ncbi:MAG: 4-hydroxythreonine-4-phosphate dehydrogenase PdxA [Planctomycetota bacterium]
MTETQKPRIGISMGDPAGVGPELCAQLLNIEEILNICTPVVFGDHRVIAIAAEKCGYPFDAQKLDVGQLYPTDTPLEGPAVMHVPTLEDNWNRPGTVCEQTGRASFDYVKTAIDGALCGEVKAVVTAPINKEAWQAAGIKYPGHTELFAERTECERFCMMMTSPLFSCSLVTTHVGYHEVPGLLSSNRISEVIQLTHAALQRIYDKPDPSLVALGLNPHAGEQGLFGNREEEAIIVPAIEDARQAGIEVAGPLPPDTAFIPRLRESTDGYICMYHDQGLIPFKALSFDTGVNVTLGLPMVRTSVDHGTALDIAWQGRADVSSLVSAIRLAVKLAD